ncbi:unnamed protein product, partial [Hymenolepis diminuta]
SILVILKELPTATLVQAVNDDLNWYASVRDSVKMANFTHSMKSSMPMVVLARPLSELTMPKQQSVSKSCLRDHLTNQIYRLR